MQKDLRRRLRSPLAPIVYLLFPFIFSLLMALAFGTGGGEESIPRVKAALVDEDGGLVARFVRGAFGQEQVTRYFEVIETSRDEALGLVRQSKIAGIIVIPEGFSTAVLEGRPTQFEVIRNPAESIGPLAIEEAAEMIAVLLDGAATVFAEPLAEIRELVQGEGAPPDQGVVEIAVMINAAFKDIGHFVFPPVIQLKRGAEQTAEGEEDEQGSQFQAIFLYAMPGMATFALFILALGFMADIPRERGLGTLARQLTAPVPANSIVAGKVLATMAMGMIVAAAMAVLGAGLFGARANLPAFALLCLTFLGAATGILTLVFGIARSEQQGGTFASILVMVMAFLGGSWIPLRFLPSFVTTLAKGTVNYWAIQGFNTLLGTGGGIGDIAGPLLVLAGIAGVGILGGGLLMQKRLMQGA